MNPSSAARTFHTFAQQEPAPGQGWFGRVGSEDAFELSVEGSFGRPCL